MVEFVMEITREQCDYLQRLSFEVDANLSVVTRLISNAKNDVDDSVLTSHVFKSYHKQMEEAMVAYDVAKSVFQEELATRLKTEQGYSKKFNWSIDDFTKPEVKITFLEDA